MGKWEEKRARGLALLVTLIVLEMVSGWAVGQGGGGVKAVKIGPLSLGGGHDWSNGREVSRAKREEQVGSSSSGGAEAAVIRKLSMSSTTISGNSSSDKESVSKSSSSGTTVSNSPPKIVVKQKTLIIPDRSPVNFTQAQIKDESLSEEVDDSGTSKRPAKGEFDEKAVQRTIIVIAGIAVIVVVYLAIKFFLIKRRKVIKRYGRVEASEMDLLDEMEDDDDESEEEELFDINQQRRS